jgi:hypothetical protein
MVQMATHSDITIRLPKVAADIVSAKEIIALLTDKALIKAEYYQSRCREMEQKYGTYLADFRKKVEESEEEIFSEWDDLIVWEGYHTGRKEWVRRHEELKNCII